MTFEKWWEENNEAIGQDGVFLKSLIRGAWHDGYQVRTSNMGITCQGIEELLKPILENKDVWLAKIFQDAMDRHKPETEICSALAWASGSIGNYLPKTGKVLFSFIKKFTDSKGDTDDV